MSMPILAVSILAAGLWPQRMPRVEDGYATSRLGGFEIRVSADLLGEPELCLSVLRAVSGDLDEIEDAVPGPALGFLRERTVIWIEKQGAVVPGGMSGRGMVFHPSAAWLSDHGLDPEKAGGIEIVRAEDYLDWREHQPMMVLHELAHAYHHGLGRAPGLEAAFDAARESGDYGGVRYVLALEGDLRRAYAMQNAREYFAELSEAYFGANDYEPFDREALRTFDPAGFDAVKRLWSLDEPGEGAGGRFPD